MEKGKMRKTFRLVTGVNILLFSMSRILLPCSTSSSSRINSFPQEEYSEYFNLGERSRLQGDYEDAIDYLTHALSLSRKNKDTRAEIESLIKLGLLYWNTGKPDDSAEFYKEALAIAEDAELNEKKEAGIILLLALSRNLWKASKKPSHWQERFRVKSMS
jgi:tetratricopeptide (TPR) repeat protein